MATDPGARTRRGLSSLPEPAQRGFWTAADHCVGGLVRDFGADDLVVGAPGCGSWLRMSPMDEGRWAATTSGPRDIWSELSELAARWRAAGCPASYRLSFDADGDQRAASACGRLSWRLPSAPPNDQEAAS